MLKTIKPNVLFSALDAEGPDRVVKVRLSKRRNVAMYHPDPSKRQNSGDVPDSSLKYFETMCLLTVIKLINARLVWEFGTHLGATTTNIALNLPNGGVVFTMDLMPAEQFKEWSTIGIDTQLIRCIGDTDSSAYDFHKFRGWFDFIWVDGNPDRTDDTRHAFEMLRQDTPAAIGWHDYQGDDPQITAFMERLGETVDLYHVEQSMCVFYFNKPLRAKLGW